MKNGTCGRLPREPWDRHGPASSHRVSFRQIFRKGFRGEPLQQRRENYKLGQRVALVQKNAVTTCHECEDQRVALIITGDRKKLVNEKPCAKRKNTSPHTPPSQPHSSGTFATARSTTHLLPGRIHGACLDFFVGTKTYSGYNQLSGIIIGYRSLATPTTQKW